MSAIIEPPAMFRTKKDWAYLQLRNWIVMGELEPGARLDQERLAEQLGVSRFPLRQALERLAMDGLVLERPHQSSTVAPIRMDDAEDVYAGREALEVMLAAEASRKSSTTSVSEIGVILSDQRRAIATGERRTYNDLDRRFHMAIYQKSGFHRSLDLLERLRSMSDRYVFLYLSDARRVETALHEHEEIFDAYRRGDPEQIEGATRAHIRHGLAELRRMLSDSER